jgi:hypothetical protein
VGTAELGGAGVGRRVSGLCRGSGRDNRRGVLAEISDRLMETLRVDLLGLGLPDLGSYRVRASRRPTSAL